MIDTYEKLQYTTNITQKCHGTVTERMNVAIEAWMQLTLCDDNILWAPFKKP